MKYSSDICPRCEEKQYITDRHHLRHDLCHCYNLTTVIPFIVILPHSTHIAAILFLESLSNAFSSAEHSNSFLSTR